MTEVLLLGGAILLVSMLSSKLLYRFGIPTLLIFLSQLPAIFISAVVIALFLLFIARPVAIFSILSWFKTPVKQQY